MGLSVIIRISRAAESMGEYLLSALTLQPWNVPEPSRDKLVLVNILSRFRKPQTQRDSLKGVIEQARRLGITPATVIDAGAANGTAELYETFPNAHHLLVEPLVEFEPAIIALKQRIAKLDYLIAALGPVEGETTIHVHPDLYGSSTRLEDEASDVNGTPRTVPVRRLDDLCANLPAPYLLKVDVQGGELDVLAGAQKVLEQTQFVVLETTLFETYKGAPQFFDVVQFMHQKGFVVYDLAGMLHRPLDGALLQVDVAFVPSNSPLRREHAYATPEQRVKQNAQFKKDLGAIQIDKRT
jgi:FkbM family methyltransferase